VGVGVGVGWGAGAQAESNKPRMTRNIGTADDFLIIIPSFLPQLEDRSICWFTGFSPHSIIFSTTKSSNMISASSACMQTLPSGSGMGST